MRYVWQNLYAYSVYRKEFQLTYDSDEFYLVLITNVGSNSKNKWVGYTNEAHMSAVLQDIDSLHLYAQVVTSICSKTLDEREVLKHAFELRRCWSPVS